jgi:ubiquinone/menaquinone biosynthesis C-methylase UbiE
VTITMETAPHDRIRALARIDAELRRMVRHSAHLTDHTVDFLRRAGLRPGMRVLDVRCREGDLSRLAALLVGTRGAVVGVDPSPDAVAAARHRASAGGLTQLDFVVARPGTFAPDARFDAVICRFALMYERAPAATLCTLARHVRPGGIVAVQELDLHRDRGTAGGPLHRQCRAWMTAALGRAGVNVGLGSTLPQTVRGAGLPTPAMILVSDVESGSRSPAYRYLAESVRALLPAIERLGLTTAAEVDTDTLEARLRAEALSGTHCPAPPALVSAWSRMPE